MITKQNEIGKSLLENRNSDLVWQHKDSHHTHRVSLRLQTCVCRAG
jgi:hypothetical protein